MEPTRVGDSCEVMAVAIPLPVFSAYAQGAPAAWVDEAGVSEGLMWISPNL